VQYAKLVGRIADFQIYSDIYQLRFIVIDITKYIIIIIDIGLNSQTVLPLNLSA